MIKGIFKFSLQISFMCRPFQGIILMKCFKVSLRLSFHNLRFNFLIIIVHVIAKHNENFYQDSCEI